MKVIMYFFSFHIPTLSSVVIIYGCVTFTLFKTLKILMRFALSLFVRFMKRPSIESVFSITTSWMFMKVSFSLFVSSYHKFLFDWKLCISDYDHDG